MNNDLELIEQKSLSVPEQAHLITVVTDENHVQAGEILVTIKTLRQEIKAIFDPMKKKAYEAHQEVLRQERVVAEPLDRAERYIKPLIANYINEKERQRQEEIRKAQEAAQKQAEDEAIALAQAAERQGDAELADRIINVPVSAPPIYNMPTAAPKISGVSTRQAWGFEITDERLIPRKYLIPDLKAIGKVVDALGDKTEIQGIRVFSKTVVAARGRK